MFAFFITCSDSHSHVEAVQYNHSVICWPLSSWELRALLKGSLLVVMKKRRAMLFTPPTHIYPAGPGIKPVKRIRFVNVFFLHLKRAIGFH